MSDKFLCLHCNQGVPDDLREVVNGDKFCIYCAPILCPVCGDNEIPPLDFAERGEDALCDECVPGDYGPTEEVVE